MTQQTFWLYLGAVVLLSATPGPNVLYVTTRSIRFGFGAAMVGMAGCLSALAVMLTASVAGVSAFMLAVPAAFETLKYAGAAYLISLGIQAWRAPVADLAPMKRRRAKPRAAVAHRGGFLVGISIPSCWSSPPPSFRSSSRRMRQWAPQFALLVATFLAIEACTYVTLGLGARGLARYLVQAVWQRDSTG